MDPITIRGDNFTATIVPESFFPMTVDKTKKFIKLILRKTWDEEKYLRISIKAIEDLISSKPEEYDLKKLKRNREDLLKELEAIT